MPGRIQRGSQLATQMIAANKSKNPTKIEFARRDEFRARSARHQLRGRIPHRRKIRVAWVASGNFIYIGASDLVPEVNRHRNAIVYLIHFVPCVSGVLLLWVLRVVLGAEG